MNGESSTFRALCDLRIADARRLRNWRMLTVTAFMVGVAAGYFLR